MKTYFFLLISIFLAQPPHAQTFDGFYFTIISPSSIYQSLGPEQYGSVGTGWGWDGTIPNDLFAEMVLAAEDTFFTGATFCDPNAIDYSGKVVLAERGLCDFSQKAWNAQNQGALALVIYNFDEDILHMAPGDFAPDVTIPCIMIPASVGEQIRSELVLGSQVIVGFSQTPHPVLRISGTVVRDENIDCQNTPGENGLQHWKIYTQGSNGFSSINYSDANGRYQLFVDTGTYEVNLISPNMFWQACPPVTVISTSYDSVQVDLPAQVQVECPMMSVDIATPLLRRCFDNNVFRLQYCNVGTTLAKSAHVSVQFDDLISVVSASLPFTSLPGNTYEFLLGDIAPNECGDFRITTHVSCEAEFSQTLCAFANIYPQVNCDSTGESYTGPSIKVNGTCTGNEVSLQIENRGEGNMDTPSGYTLFRDAKILETGIFQLAPGHTRDFNLAADGATYRLEASQPAGYPEEIFPVFTVEACVTGSGTFSTGFYNMFPSADYGQAYDEICLNVIGSFDPNDKTPTPVGYGPEHFIERNNSIHYLIRFQNTGTDTAFNIIVRDTLSGSFDLSSLELGVSSHDYTFHVLNNNILEFKFQNIQLPDSNIHEAASHGFLTYTLKQKNALPLGEVIRNTAAIYFDFNEPVLTNETFHTIGENFIGTTGIETFAKGIALQVYPNPMQTSVTFAIQNIDFQEGCLTLYNPMGQLVRIEKFQDKTFEIKRNDLMSGSYFFWLSLDNTFSASGVIQVLGTGH